MLAKKTKNQQQNNSQVYFFMITLLALHHLIFVPSLEVFCILQSTFFIVGPHVLHDLGQVLTFGGVYIHLHTRLGDLIPQLHHLLQDRRGAEREE